MNPSNPPANHGSNALAWIGLLLAFTIIAGVVWENFSNGSSNARTRGADENSNVVELTTENWQKEVVESKIPVFVDFSATWCPPCQKLAPTIEKLASSYAGRVKFGKVDVDDQKKLAVKYHISGMPSMFFFKGGEVAMNPIVGYQSEGDLIKAIDQALLKN